MGVSMADFNLEELLNCKDTDDFRAKYGSQDDDSASGILKDFVAYQASHLMNSLEAKSYGSLLNPRDIFYVQTEEQKERSAMYDRVAELDLQRPEIKDLNFDVFPKEKVAGLRSKIGLFAGLWNKFVDEVESGRVGICEVLAVDMKSFTENGNDVYYFKIANLDGLVYRGGVRKIVFPDLNNHPEEEVRGWMLPEDYRHIYRRKPEEEYQAYEAVYRANAFADTICPENKWHLYLLHFNVKGKEYFGLITDTEYNCFDRVKSSFSFLTPELCFSPMSNFTITFDW